MLNLSPPELIKVVIIIVISLTVHEFGHSLMAIRLGDDTPRIQGRLTLNPLAHIDLIGFIMLVVAGFGWAKPVMINPQALKKPQRDEILISIAGPLANILLAIVICLGIWALISLGGTPPSAADVAVIHVLDLAANINVSLAIFNMIPIPPLDGSHLITTWLKKANMALAATFFRYGSFALLALIVLERVTNLDILPIGRLTRAVVFGFYSLLGLM